MQESLAEATTMINSSKQPVIIAGAAVRIQEVDER